jgi:serine phosphatase RsbU (regulator of sigma subunit)/anti-sigma regulatory factor (Ser/Thr protein kinase)
MSDSPLGMERQIDDFDWAQTPLGPRAQWPATLRIMVGIALRTQFPMLIFWGRDLVQMYNDAFVPILGAKHPAALGQYARDCWPEIWDTVGPMLNGAFETGEAVWAEDLPLVLERHGYPEQTNFTFSYSQIGDASEDGGVLCTCVETTKAVSRETQLRETQEALRTQLEREHHTSVAFQNVALPKRLPTIPGLTFDAMYEAAGKDALVGGDWYDAFRLPDGRVVISVGDVIGNGIDAAVTMAAARQAIRGAAQVFPEPAAVLDAADRALRSEQPDRIVTAFLGVLDPLTLVFTYASAGHPPPMLRHPDGTIDELAATDLPLGLRNEGGAGKNVTTILPQDAMLVLYTDGLTESTRDILAGERRLRETLAREDIRNAASPATAIRQAVLDIAVDDVAILTLAIGKNAERVLRWSFRGDDVASAARIRRDLARVLRSVRASDAAVADAELVFGELLGNAVRHTDGHIEAALDLTGDSPVLHVLDRGPGFTFHARLPNDDMSESGRGLYIAKALARELSVVERPDGGSHARVVLGARK